MTRPFDPARLFETFRSSRHGMKNRPYPTLRAELHGVASGRKAVSRFGLTAAAFGDRELLEHIHFALAQGLLVTLHSSDRWPEQPFSVQPITAFVSRQEALWRIPALLNWQRGYGLAPADRTHELHESLLLGYSRAQIAHWHRYLDRVQRFYVYTLLSEPECARVRELAYRCFGSADELTDVTFFMKTDGVLKKNARRLLPKGCTLARTKCNHRMLRALVGDFARWRGGPYIRVRVSKRQARALTKAMQAKVELLTPAGWR